MSATTRMALPAAVLYGLLCALLATLLIGIPTDVIPNGFFTRMTPVRPQDYAFLGLTAVLTGLLAASYAFPQTRACSTQQGRTTAGGLLAFLAVGCPTCNKLVVLALGTSGALTWFEPIQPLLAAVSIVLLLLAIWVRWRPVFAHPSSGADGLRLSSSGPD